MSGADDSKGAYIWRWAHILWQRKGLRLEEFADMDRDVQLAYIASEQLADDVPLDASERMAKALLRKKN